MQGDSEDDVGCADELGAALDSLKREGCAFLVTGEAPPAVHARAAEGFLGDGDGWRVLLLSEDAYRPGPTAGADPSVVRYETAVRSATAAAAGAAADAEAVATDLEELGVAALDEIERYGTTAAESPGGFRLLVLSAAPLVADYDDEQVFAWLHLLTARVRQATGMAFVHLPLDPDDPLVPTFRPLFDGLVEVRPDAGGQQRWHLDDHTSEWMDL